MKRLCLSAIALFELLSCVTRNEPMVSEVPVPMIDTVSQGVFTDCIRIDWRTDTIAISRFTMYRSPVEAGPYESLAVVNASPAANAFFDSVKPLEKYYYKIAAIDQKGRSSKLSAGKHGFAGSVAPMPLVLRTEEYADFVALFWTPFKDAFYYAVYRSTIACTTGMALIARTSSPVFFDSTTFSGISFYTVSALDNNGHDVSISNCAWGGLGRLTAPGGGRISGGTTSHTISLEWDPVQGAREYIIYRSSSYCPKADQEFVRTKATTYRDSIGTSGYYYYAVVAVDNAGRGSAMGQCLRGSIGLLPSPENMKASYDEYPHMILLSWNALSGAHHYVVYRSTISCLSKMTKIDSTVTSSVYRDSVPTSEPCSYVVAGVDSLGIEGLPSACTQGRVKLLPAPANLKASSGLYVGKVRVSWDSVAGANGYVYYRGTSNVLEKAVPMDTVTSLFDFDSVGTTSLYYFWVAARDRLGPGKRSDYVWGRCLVPPKLAMTGYDDSTVTLSWEADTAAGAWKYIYRYFVDDEEYVCVDSATGFSYRDKPTDFSIHYYSLLLKTAVGDSLFSSLVSGSKRVPAPAGLTAAGSIDGVSLQWNNLPGITKYLVYRADSVSDSTYFISDAYDTSYFDVEATTSRYRYQVAANNGFMVSNRSIPVFGGAVAPVGAPRKSPIR